MRNLKYLFISVIIIMCFGITKISAFSISGGPSVTVGQSVAVKVEAMGLTGKFNIISSNNNVLAGGKEAEWIENETITVYFTAKSVGSAVITVNAIDVSDADGNEFTGSRSVTITVRAKDTPPAIDVNPTYSSNNYLKSLSIDGYELTPNFDKNTLEYSLKPSPGTEKIKVNATAEHNRANIKGIGEISVTEGVNTINVIVTAENGNERTYKITVTVDEKDPIEVKIDDNSYTVIKKRDLLEKRDGYTETTVNINGFEVPALYNEITNVTLIGLKDSLGNIELFSYDSKTGKYSQYKEIKFDMMNLYIHQDKESKYEKTTIKINNEETTVYKIDEMDDYYLIYATNTVTGYEGYYLYDIKENSVQRYNTDMINRLTKEKDKYLSIVLVLSFVCFLTMFFLLIEINRDNKRKK